jgi:hypothetical protein
MILNVPPLPGAPSCESALADKVMRNYNRTGPKPIRIEHHKTGEIVDHPLEDGEVKFYEEAEEVLSHLKRLGTPMIPYEVANGKAKPFAFNTMQHKVQRMRVKLGLQKHFTLDACRRGGMTELEEAELTDGQGRALSAHRTHIGYAKRTERRVLAATRKRHAHRLANETATGVQNEQQKSVQNEGPEQSAIAE